MTKRQFLHPFRASSFHAAIDFRLRLRAIFLTQLSEKFKTEKCTGIRFEDVFSRA